MSRKWTASELKNNLGDALRQAEKAPVHISRAAGGGGHAQKFVLLTLADFEQIKSFAPAKSKAIL